MNLTIKGLDINGHGIAYHKKKIVFVKGALPNEIVDVEITEEKNNFSQAKVNKIIKKSKHRVNPSCKVYFKCGGCSLMHLDYQEQLKYKQNRVRESFMKYTSLTPQVGPTIGMKSPNYYRNKVQLVVKKLKEKVVIVLYDEGSHFVTEMEECLIQDKAINKALVEIKKALNEIKIDVSNKGLRHIIVRTNKHNELQLSLVTARQMNLEQLTLQLNKIENVAGIMNVILDRKSKLLHDGKVLKLEGKSRLVKEIGDTSFYVRPLDFFQLNDIQTLKLYDHIKSLVGNGSKIVDCYAGVGSIGQYIYKGQELRGIEIVPSAVESAKDNCRLNKIDADYAVGSVGNVLKRWSKAGYKPDLMIFDPPRPGLDPESITTILKVKPKSIIYVSCNPSTLAKDINFLSDKYDVVSVQPFDMFPQTAHVECCVKLNIKRK